VKGEGAPGYGRAAPQSVKLASFFEKSVATWEKPSFSRVSSGAKRSSYWIAAIARTMKAAPAKAGIAIN
jgi:hypothetical protein